MKLNKETKHLVEVGDNIRFTCGNNYKVVTVIKSANGGLNFTLEDVKDGRRIYSYPSSKCYGAEILKGGVEILEEEENIVSEEKAMDIIKAQLAEGVKRVKAETGVEVDPLEYLYEVLDSEWIWHDVDEEHPCVEIQPLLRNIERIISNNIKWIKQEQEAEKEYAE